MESEERGRDRSGGSKMKGEVKEWKSGQRRGEKEGGERTER